MRVGRVLVVCKLRRESHHNAVVNYSVSSFGMFGERSYLPDTGSRARNNKRILGIEPTAEWDRPTTRRKIRGRERNKKKRKGRERKRREGGLVEGYDVLALVRLFDVGRESALYLTPNQLRSAVPDKILSLFSLHLSPLSSAQLQCIYIYARRQRLTGDSTRGGGLRILSHRAQNTSGASPSAALHRVAFVPRFLLFPLPPLHRELTSSSSSMCMHPSNELSLATL